MLLHHEFIKVAKKKGEKLAFIDRTTDRRIPYSKALIASLMLAEKFKAYDEGFIGLMIPTSAGCGLAMLAALMTGRTPVMINYSTGAANNAEFAQKKCDFKTIIASRALVEKINCRFVPGMIFIEDIMASITIADKLKAALKSKLPLPMLTRSVYQGTEDDNIVILFTSGSEKDPKAVQLTHKNISANLEGINEAFKFTDKDIFLANLPYFRTHGGFLASAAAGIDNRNVCEPARF
jgi:acyl-[acyl-carrier-protein]-phospholipid O-acyltransferase/long-chain-fatty-acid--[acyl-carrier-protein] ligase